MSDLLVIGIGGQARAGKDTVGQHLVSEYGFTRLGLADGVRSAFAEIDGPTWELRKELDNTNKTNRWVMQTLGTECRNEIDCKLHWVNHLLVKIAYLAWHHPSPRSWFVVTDIRFPHEIERIREAIEPCGRFVSWRVTRPGFGLMGAAAKHSSETSVDDLDSHGTIFNDGTLAELRASVDTLAVPLILPHLSK